AAQVAEDARTQGAPAGVGVEVGATGAEDDRDAQLVVATRLAALQTQLDVDRRAAAQAQPRQAARRGGVDAARAAQANREPARRPPQQFAPHVVDEAAQLVRRDLFGHPSFQVVDHRQRVYVDR